MPVVAMPDGTRVAFPDDMTPDAIRGMISQKFPDESKAASFADRFAAVGPYESNPEARDHGLARRQQMSAAEKAVSPITEYPEVYSRMNRDARSMVSEGVDQLRSAGGVLDVAKGAGKAALGAASFVASPINAAYRTVVGQPLEDTAGIPREYSEFAAQLATPGIGLTGGGGKAAVTVRTPDLAAPSVAELKAAAKNVYQSPTVKDLELAPQEVSKAVVGIRSALDNEGFDEVIASKAHGILKRLENAPEGAVMTGQNLRSVQRSLGKAITSPDATEQAAARMALNEFNSFIENIPGASVLRGSADEFSAAVKEANANYSAAKTAESLDKNVAAAQLRADASNSGHNISNTIRQRMASIHAYPRQQRGMRPDELQQVKEIAEGTTGENILRDAGNMMGGGGGMRAAITGTAGYMAGGPAGAAIPVGGMILRSLSNRMTLAKAEKLSDMIRSRAPLAEKTQRFEASIADFQKARNSQSAAAATVAAQDLSNSLKEAGFNIPAVELMRVARSNQATNEAEND